MWHDAIRKYDGCTGVEVFTWDGEFMERQTVGEVRPLISSKMGNLYSFIEYDCCTSPVWRMMLRSNDNDTYLWTTTSLDKETQRVSINGAVIFLRDTMTLIIEEDNILVFAGHINSLDRIDVEEVKMLNNVSLIIQKLTDYGYKPIWFEKL